ncbi:hypothetical protein BJX64DRAFT_246467 [Aspergillus heterothallicus]
MALLVHFSCLLHILMAYLRLLVLWNLGITGSLALRYRAVSRTGYYFTHILKS